MIPLCRPATIWYRTTSFSFLFLGSSPPPRRYCTTSTVDVSTLAPLQSSGIGLTVVQGTYDKQDGEAGFGLTQSTHLAAGSVFQTSIVIQTPCLHFKTSKIIRNANSGCQMKVSILRCYSIAYTGAF
jgi:hypothetical protein